MTTSSERASVLLAASLRASSSDPATALSMNTISCLCRLSVSDPSIVDWLKDIGASTELPMRSTLLRP